jgi:hypothetical protein
MGNLKGYAQYTPEQAEQDAVQFTGGQFYEWKSGDSVVRILPPKEGRASPFRTTMQHKISIGGQLAFHTCARVEYREECMICSANAELLKRANNADAQVAKDLEGQTTTYALLVDRATEEAGPQPARIPFHVTKALKEFQKDTKLGGDFCDPYQGFDVVVTKSGSGKGTRYEVRIARSPSPLVQAPDGTLDEELAQSWLDNMPDLDSLVRVPDLAAIETQMRTLLAMNAPTRTSAPGIGVRAARPVPALAPPAVPPLPAPAARGATRTAPAKASPQPAQAASAPAPARKGAFSRPKPETQPAAGDSLSSGFAPGQDGEDDLPY